MAIVLRNLIGFYEEKNWMDSHVWVGALICSSNSKFLQNIKTSVDEEFNLLQIDVSIFTKSACWKQVEEHHQLQLLKFFCFWFGLGCQSKHTMSWFAWPANRTSPIGNLHESSKQQRIPSSTQKKCIFTLFLQRVKIL